MTKLLRYACMLLFLASMPILTKAQCTVNAGADKSQCLFPASLIMLSGSVAGNFTTYSWTSSGGGVLSGSTTLNPSYTYNAADIVNGTITFTLTASGGTCASVSDQIVITVQKMPTVVLQNEFTACGSTIPLTATTTGAITLQWNAMTGSGTFSTTTAANTVYSASAADITRGYIFVRLNGASSLAGCFNEDSIRVNIATSVSLNAGTDATICNTPTSTVVFSEATGEYTTYSWTTSGTGTFSNPTQLSSPYILSSADIAAGSVTLTLTGNSTTCGTASDTRTVTVLSTPIVSAGADQTICGNTAALNGTVTPASGVILDWANVIGSGTFANNTTLTPTYNAAAADITRGYALVRLRATSSTGCVNEDSVRINIAASASVDAGPDYTICTSNPGLELPGATTLGGIASTMWSTSGTGTFLTPSSLLSVYVPSSADKAAGMVTLTLTGTSPCGTVSDALILTIIQSSVFSAGPDQNICGSTATLNGTVTSSGTIIEWFGSGTFSSNTILAPTYTMAPADIARGYAIAQLAATSSAGCVEIDTVLLHISSPPIVFAGSNQVSCSGTVTVHGYAINASSKAWTTNGSGTFANTSSDTTIYTPSSADRTSRQVILTYTGTNTCSSASSTTQINFIPNAPRISAGIDESICGRDTIQLIGSVADAAGGSWTTTGTGNFLFSPSHLVNLYKLSAADKISGSVSFTLTSYSAGGCAAVSDVKTVTITSGTLPNVYAGSDQVSAITTQLNATVSNATSQLWETSGVGVFTPSPTSLNASYIPSASDIAAGSVVLKLVATGSCGTAYDALTLFTATPSSISGTVKAGSNTLDHGVVYLFSTNDTQGRILVGIDTIFQSSNGAYEFSSVIAGNYTVYAVPLAPSIYAATYLATYLGSTTATEWQSAGQMEITNGSAAHVLNVDLEAYTSAAPNWNTGVDTISGAVFLGMPITVMRLVSSYDDPLAGVVVYLKTLNGQVITYTSTDKYGVYSFNNVLSGNYFIDPEYPQTGVILNQKIAAVDGNPETIEDGNVTVLKVYLATGILSSGKSMQIQAYPNPTSDNVNLQLNKVGNYSVKVLDETGVVHIEQQLVVTSDAASVISLSNLNKGMYIIQITSGDEVYNTKVVKF